jgi:hypothetical protein
MIPFEGERRLNSAIILTPLTRNAWENACDLLAPKVKRCSRSSGVAYLAANTRSRFFAIISDRTSIVKNMVPAAGQRRKGKRCAVAPLRELPARRLDQQFQFALRFATINRITRDARALPQISRGASKVKRRRGIHDHQRPRLIFALAA